MAKKAKEERLLRRVKDDMKEVVWPKAKDVFKYTMATVILCGIFIIFFLLINLLASFVKGMF